MRKILLFIKTLNLGGAEHMLVNVANRLTKDGYQVAVQTMFDEGVYREKLMPQVEYRAGLNPKSRLLREIGVRLPLWFWDKFLIPKDYTYYVAFMEGWPARIIGSCHRKNAQKIAWIHTDIYANYGTNDIAERERIDRKCYRTFDQVLCVSEDAKKGFIKRIGLLANIDVQYNPTEKEEVLRKSQLEPVISMPEKNSIRLVAVGRLEKVKGFDLLIEAISLVKKQSQHPVELYLVGNGSEWDNLREMIREKDLQDNVTLCGQQENPYSIMRHCDMLVIPSRAEGYSLVLCEGQILGLPIVATKCSGPTEILTDSEAGILVDISSEAIADGIIKMLNDKALFAKCKGKAQQWSKDYDENAIYRQIESRFQN